MSRVTKTIENGFDNPVGDKDNAPFINSQLVPVNTGYSIVAGPTQSVSTCEVTITVLDGHGVLFPEGTPIMVWLSDNATGIGLTIVSATDTRPKSGSGALFGTLTAKKALIVQTLGNGSLILEIRDNTKPEIYVAVQSPFSGITKVSRQLMTTDYGNSV